MKTRPKTDKNASKCNTINNGDVLLRIDCGSRGEEIRITFKSYKAKRYVDCRRWYCPKDGGWLPSHKGITLSAAELEVVVNGLEDARAQLAEELSARRPAQGPTAG